MQPEFATLLTPILKEFALSSHFSSKMQLAFGIGEYGTLQEAFSSEQLILPPIEIRSSIEINRARGAFSSDTNKIYLSEELLSENNHNSAVIRKVLLEEYGHFLDSLDGVDAAGDEGAIFANLVEGVSLSDTTLTALKTEDDTITVFLDGQQISLEQSNTPFQPIGTEFKVDVSTVTTSRITTPDVAIAANGDFVVVWTIQIGNDRDIRFRRFNADGSPKDNVDRIVASGFINEFSPSVAMAADGSFAVAYVRDGNNDNNDTDIRVIRFNADGNSVGGQTLVPTSDINQNQTAPDIAMDDEGDFMVVWTHEFSSTDLDIRGRAFNKDGTPLGDDFSISTASQKEFDPSIDIRPGSDPSDPSATYAVVSWTQGASGSESIYFRRYGVDINSLGSADNANIFVSNGTKESSVALDQNGNFTIAWTQTVATGNDNIRFRQFSASGTPQTTTEQVADSSGGDQDEPVIAMRRDGRFVIAYEDDADDSVKYKEYGADGRDLTGRRQRYDVNHGFEDNPALAINSNGSRMVIVADDDGSNAFDPWARIFDSPPITSNLDFNGDGKSDILWRNKANGKNAIWLMDGTELQSGVLTTTAQDLNWQMTGSGDFNGDGKSDILWRNKANGKNAIWLMDGTELESAVFTSSVTDLNWQMTGSGDFNGDGKDDLLWRNTANGKNAIWLMDGTELQSGVLTTAVTDLNWQMTGSSDFNGDGKDDLLWRNTANGKNAIWLMDGTELESGVLTTVVTDLNWQMVI